LQGLATTPKSGCLFQLAVALERMGFITILLKFGVNIKEEKQAEAELWECIARVKLPITKCFNPTRMKHTTKKKLLFKPFYYKNINKCHFIILVKDSSVLPYSLDKFRFII
jgi:hypothetical protein